MLALLAAAALLAEPTAVDTARPTLTPAAAVKPAAARGEMLDAVAVTVECTARANGLVENCKVLGETHPGLGFGDAAVALMNGGQVDPGARDVQFARTIQFTP